MIKRVHVYFDDCMTVQDLPTCVMNDLMITHMYLCLLAGKMNESND